jgi:hypothetical protein
MWYDDSSFFPVLHLVFPFLLALYFPRNEWKVLALVYLWESAEMACFELVAAYPFAFSSNSFEPGPNSLLLDPLQGLLGILLAGTCGGPRHRAWTFWILLAILCGPPTVTLEWTFRDTPVGYYLFALTFFIALLCLVHLRILPQGAYKALFIVVFSSIPMGDNVVFRTWVAALPCFVV